MKKLCLSILAILCPLAVIAMSIMPKARAEEKIIFSLDSATKKQGEFFSAIIRGAEKKPRIWFNTREFSVFEIDDPEPEKSSEQVKKPDKVFRALIPVENMTEPGRYSILAKQADWEEKIFIEVKDNGKGVQQITLDESKSTLTATAKELNEVGAGLRASTGDKLWQGKFIYPSPAPRSSPFGVKRSYNKGPINSYHKGLDFAGEHGSPVYAPSDAKVVVVGYEKEGYAVHGNAIILDHGHSVTSIYMHLSKINVKLGDKVKQGDKIGEIGHTGISTGPHLHWGVYLSGISVEPELFVAKEVK
jgi:murein DD-endopeptidase MepM/ murein hydrolase activator NlpD